VSHPNRALSQRSCKGCSACCYELEIKSRIGYSTLLDTGEDIAKPQGVWCRFATPKGCSVYEQRPALCRDFACDWILGRKGFGINDSPSQLGLIGVRGERVECTDNPLPNLPKTPEKESA
jgi:hypothetical protein